MCHKVLCTFHQLHLFTCSNVNMYHACFINKYNTTHDPTENAQVEDFAWD